MSVVIWKVAFGAMLILGIINLGLWAVLIKEKAWSCLPSAIFSAGMTATAIFVSGQEVGLWVK